jgi:hypothetical protein
MFGLICEKDFAKIGFTSGPTSKPTEAPDTEIQLIETSSSSDISASAPASDCSFFGLLCKSKPVKREAASQPHSKEVKMTYLQRKNEGSRLRARV